jgi:hypothetical protein
VAGNQTDFGGPFRPGGVRGQTPLLRVVHCDDPTSIHKNWRQTDLPTPYEGESGGATGKGPRLVGKNSEEERALLDAVSGSAGLVTWH